MSTATAAGDRTRGVLLVAAAGVLFSTLGLGVRLMEEASAWQIIFYRGLFQAAAVTGWVLVRNQGRLREPFGRIGWPGLLGAVALGLAYNGMIVALTLTSVASVVFMFATGPLVTGLLAWWLLGESVPPRTFGAMAIALCGVLAMALGDPGDTHLAGILAASVAVLGASVFTVSLRRGREVDMLPSVALAGIAGALISTAGIDSFSMTGRDIALTLYLGGVALAVGLAMFTAGSRHLRAAELPLVAMTEPVLAPIWVWIALGEVVGASTLIGGAIVLVAVLLQGTAS